MSNQQENDSFFQEVDERLRQDRYGRMAKRWGPWAAAAFVLVLVSVGATEGWKAYSENQARQRAVAFAAAQEDARAENAVAATAAARFEELAGDGPKVYRVMSLMEQAASVESQGDLPRAIELFDRAASMADDPVLRDSARLRAAYIVAGSQDFQAVQTRLQPLIESDTQISYLAKELLAVEAWEAGQTDLARTTFDQLQLAFQAPESVRQRAQLAMSVVGPAPAPAGGAPSTTTTTTATTTTTTTRGAANTAQPSPGETK